MAEEDSIKLGDFGSSRILESTTDLTTHAGTFEYMSPELQSGRISINHDSYSYNTDCWSIGCVLYELITLEIFHYKGLNNDERIQEEIQSLQTLVDFKDLLTKMLQGKASRAKSSQLRFRL